MPKIEKVTQTYNGTNIECAHIVITKDNEIFRFSNVFNTTSEYNMEDDYAWQMVARANGNRTITLTVGDQNKTFALTNKFARYTNVFYGVKPSVYPYVEISFPVGQYWFYHVQLEHGNAITDWHPHPDDGVDTAVAISNENLENATSNIQNEIKNWVTFYDTRFEKTDESILLNARAITVNENNIEELRESTEASFQVQANQISSIVQNVEVVDGKVDGLATTVSTNYSTITQKQNSIESNVAAITNYMGGASEISSSTLQQTANNISLQVTSNAINNMEIGGSNILKNTGTYNGWLYSNSVTISNPSIDGSCYASFSAASSVSYRNLQSKPRLPYSLIRNKTVTLSFYIRSDDYDKYQNSQYGYRANIYLYETETGGLNDYVKLQPFSSYSRDVENGWKRIVITQYINDEWFKTGSGTITDSTLFAFVFFNRTEYRLDIKQIQLEIGTKATAWNDKVNVSDFNGNEIVSKINIATNKINMEAVNIDLTGYVTFNNLKTSGQTLINGGNITTGIIQDNISNPKNYWNLTTGDFVTRKGRIGSFYINDTSISRSANGIDVGAWNTEGNIYFGLNGLSFGNIFVVDSKGNTTASNLNLTGGTIDIRKDNKQIFRVTDSGVNIYDGTISLNNGKFYVDADGNCYVNKIFVRNNDNETGTNHQSEILYMGTNPTTDVVGGKLALISESMIAKNLIVQNGIVEINSSSNANDSFYNYIKLNYKWTDANYVDYMRTTKMTSNGMFVTTVYGLPSGNFDDANDVTIYNMYGGTIASSKFYDNGFSSEYSEIMNFLSDVRKGQKHLHSASIDNYKIQATIDDLTIFAVYTDNDVYTGQLHPKPDTVIKNTIIIGNNGCDGTGYYTDNFPKNVIPASKTYIYGEVYFSDISKIYFPGSNQNRTIAEWIDSSNHTFSGRINLPNGAGLTYVYDSGQYITLKSYVEKYSTGSGGSGGSIDTTDFAKLSSGNTFVGSNNFEKSVSIGNDSTTSNFVTKAKVTSTFNGAVVMKYSTYLNNSTYIRTYNTDGSTKSTTSLSNWVVDQAVASTSLFRTASGKSNTISSTNSFTQSNTFSGTTAFNGNVNYAANKTVTFNGTVNYVAGKTVTFNGDVKIGDKTLYDYTNVVSDRIDISTVIFNAMTTTFKNTNLSINTDLSYVYYYTYNKMAYINIYVYITTPPASETYGIDVDIDALPLPKKNANETTVHQRYVCALGCQTKSGLNGGYATIIRQDTITDNVITATKARLSIRFTPFAGFFVGTLCYPTE